MLKVVHETRLPTRVAFPNCKGMSTSNVVGYTTSVPLNAHLATSEHKLHNLWEWSVLQEVCWCFLSFVGKRLLHENILPRFKSLLGVLMPTEKRIMMMLAKSTTIMQLDPPLSSSFASSMMMLS